MDEEHKMDEDLTAELQELRGRLKEAEDTLDAISSGTIDAMVISGPDGPNVYTLTGADAVYRTFFEQMAEGALTVNARGTILSCNQRFSMILGLPIEEILGNTFQGFVDFEDIAPFETALTKSIKDKCRKEITLNCQLNKVFQLSLVALAPLSSSVDELVCVVVTDITERKRAEVALRLSEERFRALFDGAQDMIFMMDSHRKYTKVNPATAKVLGLDVSEIIGHKPEEVYGEEIGKQLRLLDLRVLGGESIEREHTIRIKGVSLTLNTVLRPLYDAEGKVIGVFGISRDVTERSRVSPTPKAVFESYPSEAMRATMCEARSAAASDGTVLLQGESGSGKDYLARWIHDHSKRALGPYFSLNCAAISKELAESELFGHERGAFTGAHRRKRGLLELAEGGTLLLNEIGELPLSLQSKLLTFLDTRSFLRVGAEKSVSVNARIIAATNRSLDKEVEEGRFLSALFYRINVFGITVPPLRERIEDIPVLLEEIMSRLAVQLQLTHLPSIDPAFAIALTRYDWPGNVREFRNVLERSLMLSDGHRLSLTLPSGKASSEDWSQVYGFPSQERTLHDVTDEVIKSLILEALRRCEGNRRSAARTLGIARDSLYRHMKRFGIMSENRTADEDD
ncbi:MAG: sigma 54-interacting transcriptional regulator [Desulfomonilaceae bacterium]|jgi:PAS domain S-box-containing protein